jgi:hypothetical protein
VRSGPALASSLGLSGRHAFRQCAHASTDTYDADELSGRSLRFPEHLQRTLARGDGTVKSVHDVLTEQVGPMRKGRQPGRSRQRGHDRRAEASRGVAVGRASDVDDNARCRFQNGHYGRISPPAVGAS